MSLIALAAGARLAIGGIQALYGHTQAKEAQAESDAARDAMGNINYGDYTQGYYNTLRTRDNYGLEASQKAYMENQANRAASVSLMGADNRRMGLLGLGQAQTRLSDAYRQIGMLDTQEELRKKEITLAEQLNRGVAGYNEDMQMAQLDYAEARSARQEGNQLAQTGLHNIANSLFSAAYLQSLSPESGGDKSVTKSDFWKRIFGKNKLADSTDSRYEGLDEIEPLDPTYNPYYDPQSPSMMG